MKIRTMIAMLLILCVMFVTACSSNSSAPSDSSAANQSGNAEQQQSYTLRVATSLDSTTPQLAGFNVFVDSIEEASDGRIKIEYVGGPEAIPSTNQGDAVSTGAIDMTWLAGGYYSELVPEVLAAAVSEISYEEELERGAWDYLNKFHEEKMNTKMLGRAGEAQYAFYIADGIDISSMEDFNGLRIRGHAMYTPIIEGLGAAPISMSGGEIYSALEKHMIDGFGWGFYGVLDLGVQDLISAKVQPTFNKEDVYLLMNLDKWNSLPEDLQQVIEDVAMKSYQEHARLTEEAVAQENATLEAAGVKIVELQDGDQFLKMVSEESWKWLGGKIENIEELEKYFKK